MALLAIDTATDRMGVALVDDGRLLASYELLAERPHASELPQAVTRVLDAGGATLPQLEGLAVDIGPGSFTGLRIGLAFVKALAFASKRPVVGVSSLEVLANGVPLTDAAICPLLDAKRRQVYAAVFRAVDGAVRRDADDVLAPIDELPRLIPTGPVLFLGDGAELYRAPLIAAAGARARFAPPELSWPNAGTLGRLALARLRRGERDDPKTLLPRYLYSMDCTIRPSSRQPGAPRKTSAGRA